MATSKVPTSQTYANQVPKDVFAGQREFADKVTFNAEVTSLKPPVISVGAVDADGSTQADAGDVPDYPLVIVDDADATKGVILPASLAGKVIKLYNLDAAALKVYPPSGGDFNDGTANANITMDGKTEGVFTCLDGVTWSAVYTAPA